MDRRSFLFGAAKAVAAVSTVSYFDIGDAWAKSTLYPYWDDGYAFVMEDMPLTEFQKRYLESNQAGISMKFIKQFEIVKGKSSRYDAIYGWGKLPENELQLSHIYDPDSWDDQQLEKGDIVEIPSVFKVNPEFRRPVINPENLDEMVKSLTDDIDRRGLEAYEKFRRYCNPKVKR